MPLLEESCPIYSFRPMPICVLASCQDILTGSLYLGPLETRFFNLALDIIPHINLHATAHAALKTHEWNVACLKQCMVCFRIYS